MLHRLLLTVLFPIGLLVFVGCSSNEAEQPPAPPPVEEPVQEEAPAAQIAPDTAGTEGGAAELDSSPINFAYDEATLTEEAKSILEAKAKYLTENPDGKLQIEGHCDERGSNQYNLALGERRANSTKDYLISLGVNGAQLSTISYGEERPAISESNENAWSKNRRCEFIRIK